MEWTALKHFNPVHTEGCRCYIDKAKNILSRVLCPLSSLMMRSKQGLCWKVNTLVHM
jgi:hypothetical protein